MNNFFKYISLNQEEKNWGICLTVAGTTRILPGMEYPSGNHPKGYYFRWERGRILNEYQLIYITDGEGILESKTQKVPVKPGTVILIYPGAWHRYRPKPSSGWNEIYIGIEGDVTDRLMAHPMLRKSQVVACGLQEPLLECYNRILDLVRDGKPGFQFETSGYIVRIIGILISSLKSQEFGNKPTQTAIENIRFLIHQNAEQKIDFKEMAASQNIGYSHFRKQFKKYTGASPVNYHLNLKLLKAKELLLHSDKTLKEIAFETGFFSESYFSRIFKEKIGHSPSSLRSKNKS